MRLLACLLVIAALLLTACGGGGALAPGVWLDVTVLPDGAAQLDLRVPGGGIRTDAELRALSGQIAATIFPNTRGVQVTIKDSPGYPVARADIPAAYRTGRTVSARIDTAPVWSELTRRGVTEARVRLWLPSVPAQMSSSAKPVTSHMWLLRRGRPAPSIAFILRPQPVRWFGEMALLIFAAVCVAMAVVWRRRLVSVPAAAGVLAAAIATVVTAGGRQGDNLGVTGMMHGVPLTIATAAPLVTLALGVLAVAVLLRSAIRLSQSRAAARGAAATIDRPPESHTRV